MYVLGVEGSEKKCGPRPSRTISGTALEGEPSTDVTKGYTAGKVSTHTTCSTSLCYTFTFAPTCTVHVPSNCASRHVYLVPFTSP